MPLIFYRKIIPLFLCLLLLTVALFVAFFGSNSIYLGIDQVGFSHKSWIFPADSSKSNVEAAASCKAYDELRNINFLSDSIRDRICSGTAAYAIVNGSFPLCRLRDRLPDEIMDQVRSGSQLASLRSPVTGRSLPCYIYSERDYISDEIRKRTGFETNNVAALIGLLRRIKSDKGIAPNGVTFVDVGSNIGVFSLAAMDLGIRSHLVWNFISSRVSLSYLNFPVDCNVGGATKFSRAVADTIPVMSSSGNALARILDPGSTLIMKIDIEGGEADFLKTSYQLFDNFSIPVVQMEWLRRHMSRDEMVFMMNFFTSRGYVPTLGGSFASLSTARLARFNGDIFWTKLSFFNQGHLFA
uniref:Methyltransf_21 domain-containing protein n=1 Tax=Macrostomum lignano TaxID=282301 RepID=A0A1I8IH94_9PLAT